MSGRGRTARQAGQALIALVAVIMMGASWLLMSKLNAASGDFVAAKRARNAEVLAKAKQALIGYVVAQANKAGENNPGSLPCPENPGDFDSAIGRQGLIGTSCGTTVKVGRFPWRTLGLDRLVDASGEPLWYVVSPNWGLNIGSNTYINSNTAGNLTVDGVPNAAIALIIAPGPAVNAAAATGCTAWTQTRSPSGTPDWRNYLECENASSPTDSSFVTTGSSGSAFNDQVMVVTASDILPPLEAAIANRIQREIAPALNAVYPAASWGLTGSNPLYPYAAPFSAPGPGTGTSNYQGVSGTYSGLLPFNQTQGCTADPANPRCLTTLLSYAQFGSDVQTGGSGSIRTSSTCSLSGAVYTCTGQYNAPSIYFAFKMKVTNVAMGLRKLDASKVTCSAVDDAGGGIGTQTVACSVTAALQSDGSAILTVAGGPTPDIVASGWGTYANYSIRIDKAVIGDHALLDSTDATTGWFVRNEWYRMTYYATARGLTASASTFPSLGCITGGSGSTGCLSITSSDPFNPISPVSGQRALLILAGQAVTGQTRPATGGTAVTDYLESGNATGAWVRRPASKAVPAFNDRLVVVGSN